MLEEKKTRFIGTEKKSSKKHKTDPDIRKARNAGGQCARRGGRIPIDDKLENKYTPMQIEAYKRAYNAACRTEEEQAFRKARNAGRQHARRGKGLSSEAALLRRGYTGKSAEVYIKAYYQYYNDRNIDKTVQAISISSNNRNFKPLLFSQKYKKNLTLDANMNEFNVDNEIPGPFSILRP